MKERIQGQCQNWNECHIDQQASEVDQRVDCLVTNLIKAEIEWFTFDIEILLEKVICVEYLKGDNSIKMNVEVGDFSWHLDAISDLLVSRNLQSLHLTNKEMHPLLHDERKGEV